jgi:hypothetical protein
MPPQAQAPAPTQVPTGQVNPMMMALLKARAMQGAQGGQVGPAPNSLPTGGPPGMPPPPTATAGPMPAPQGGASPAQQIMKGASAAQSPLMDDQTRTIAKSLIQKLMQHM